MISESIGCGWDKEIDRAKYKLRKEENIFQVTLGNADLDRETPVKINFRYRKKPAPIQERNY